MGAPLTEREILRRGAGQPIFPSCGHPRIPENIVSVGIAGTRCRLCRRKIANRHGAKLRGQG